MKRKIIHWVVIYSVCMICVWSMIWALGYFVSQNGYWMVDDRSNREGVVAGFVVSIVVMALFTTGIVTVIDDE